MTSAVDSAVPAAPDERAAPATRGRDVTRDETRADTTAARWGIRWEIRTAAHGGATRTLDRTRRVWGRIAAVRAAVAAWGRPSCCRLPERSCRFIPLASGIAAVQLAAAACRLGEAVAHRPAAHAGSFSWGAGEPEDFQAAEGAMLQEYGAATVLKDVGVLRGQVLLPLLSPTCRRRQSPRWSFSAWRRIVAAAEWPRAGAAAGPGRARRSARVQAYFCA